MITTCVPQGLGHQTSTSMTVVLVAVTLNNCQTNSKKALYCLQYVYHTRNTLIYILVTPPKRLPWGNFYFEFILRS